MSTSVSRPLMYKISCEEHWIKYHRRCLEKVHPSLYSDEDHRRMLEVRKNTIKAYRLQMLLTGEE